MLIIKCTYRNNEKILYSDLWIAIYYDFFETGDIWLDKRVVHEDAQNWRLNLYKADSTVAFESEEWPGYFLGAGNDDDAWLELRSQSPIKWTVNSTTAQVPDETSSEKSTIPSITEDNSSEKSTSPPVPEDKSSEKSTSSSIPGYDSSEY